MANTQVVFDILANDKASKVLAGIGGEAEKTHGLMGKLGGGLATVAKAAGVALVAGVGAAGFVMKDAIGQASDLSETINKSNVIFGGNAKMMEQWASGAARAFGLSKAEALGAAANFGNMFSQLGFGGDQAADMAKQVIQLSTDLGSFNNLPTADVADMMSAAFRGEFDSLQALIPNINAARVEQEAMAMTGKKNAKELTAQEKAAATLAIVQKDGAAAAGDFAETSGGLANQQKILGALWDDLKGKIGTGLLPVMEKFAGFVTDRVLPGLEGLFALFTKGDVTSGLTSAFGVAEDSKFVDFLFNVRETAIEIFTEVKAGITAFVAAFKDGGDDVTSSGFAGFLEGLGVVARDLFDYFKTTVLPRLQEFAGFLVGTVIPAIAGVVTWLIQHKDLVVAVVGGITAAVVAFKTVTAVIRLWAAAQAALNLIMSLNPIGIIIALIVGLVAAFIIAYKNSETFRNIVDGALKAVGTAAQWLWDKILAVKDGIVAAWDWVKQKASDLAVSVAGFLGRIGSKATEMKDNIRNAVDLVVGFFTGLPGRVSGIFGGMFDGIQDAFKSAINWVIRKWNGLSFTLPSVEIPGLGTVGGGTLSTPNIPLLAKGGIVTKPTLAMIGEAGPEAVVPLNQYRGGGNGPIDVNITFTDPFTGIRKYVRTQAGGSVQVAFGT